MGPEIGGAPPAPDALAAPQPAMAQAGRAGDKGRRGARPQRLGAVWRLLARAMHHPRYALHVLATLARHPRLCGQALRHGWRQATLAYCAALQPEIAALLSPYEAGFFGQVFLFDEYEIGRLRLPRHPVVLDIGANVGLFSWRVHALRPEARILAFEPAGANFERLQRTFEVLAIHGTPRHEACGAEAGTATLFLRNSVTHSLDPGWHPDLDQGAGVETVAVVTVDLACQARDIADVDVLKVDVEGAEDQVLAGATATLRRTRHVVLEYHSAALGRACRDLLAAAGFRCRTKHFWGVRAQGGDDEEGLLLCTRVLDLPAGSRSRTGG